MKVRRFILENEKGQQFRLDNLDEGCFLTSPSELGYAYNIDFVQLGNEFIENNRRIEQKKPKGTLYFKTYDKVKEFGDFVERSKNLKWLYIIPFEKEEKTYYRDVSIIKLEKTEKSGRWLACSAEFAGLSLWYEQNETIFKIETYEDEMRYNYRWNSRYIDYNTRAIQFDNRGHVEAPIQVEIDGFVQNPTITVLVDDEEYAVSKFQSRLMNLKNFYIQAKQERYTYKNKTQMEQKKIYGKKNILILQNKIFSNYQYGVSEIRLTAEDDVLNAKLTIFPQYKVV